MPLTVVDFVWGGVDYCVAGILQTKTIETSSNKNGQMIKNAKNRKGSREENIWSVLTDLVALSNRTLATVKDSFKCCSEQKYFGEIQYIHK